MAPRIRAAAVSVLAAALAFLLYRSTMLPGLELGDSASFQLMGGSPRITPRDGYPLYYALAAVFVWFSDDPAAAMNMVSVIQAALACGLVVLAAAQLSGSLAAACASALLFGTSYTFWSQSAIAEVYALHIVLVLLSLIALLRWERRPGLARLGLFFAVYALSFGNHLSMILLAPAFTLFLAMAAPGGWRALLSSRVLVLAAVLAAAGALQYLWNLTALWNGPQPPATIGEGLQAFWFDVTKADWRETMVLGVDPATAGERVRMYGFDLWQQFGWIAPFVSLAGGAALWRSARPRALLLVCMFAVPAVFALGYNVGDAHVFFLPSHLVIALLVAPGLAWAGSAARAGSGAAAVLILLIGFRAWSTYPALDRSDDHRPARLLDALTEGIDDQRAVLLTDLNWQVQNGMYYYGARVRPEAPYARLAEVLLYAPALIRDNAEIGRDIVLAGRAKDVVEASYGPLYRYAPYGTNALRLSEAARGLPPGTRYVLTVLRPAREFPIDVQDLDLALHALSGGADVDIGLDGYAVVAGVAGQPPVLVRTSARPFREQLTLQDTPVVVRMDSWLEFDTIRRMGFGHVIANRRHTQIIERGISFVAFDAGGRPSCTVYAAGIYAPPPRYVILRHEPPS